MRVEIMYPAMQAEIMYPAEGRQGCISTWEAVTVTQACWGGGGGFTAATERLLHLKKKKSQIQISNTSSKANFAAAGSCQGYHLHL